VPVEVLFNFLLSDGAFGFLDDFHKKCGDKGWCQFILLLIHENLLVIRNIEFWPGWTAEFSCSKWRTDEQGGLVRDVSFLHPIKIYLGKSRAFNWLKKLIGIEYGMGYDLLYIFLRSTLITLNCL
jgi:hypothetical protein